jgi:hypothetical protein
MKSGKKDETNQRPTRGAYPLWRHLWLQIMTHHLKLFFQHFLMKSVEKANFDIIDAFIVIHH